MGVAFSVTCNGDLGPVVQSIISLTSLLRGQLVYTDTFCLKK